jgi:hypothetical protein
MVGIIADFLVVLGADAVGGFVLRPLPVIAFGLEKE